MFTRLFRIFSLLIALILIVSGIYFGKLYRATTAAFEALKPQISQANDISPAKLFIRDILFSEASRTQAKPAELVARTRIKTQSRQMFNYQMEKIVLASRLKNEFSDEQILSFWLSSIYYGEGEHGLETAAKSLFDKDINALTNEELIALAALIKSPQLRGQPIRWKKEQARLQQQLENKG